MPTVTHPRGGAIGEPERKWYIVPAIVPVPPPLHPEKLPAPAEAPDLEPQQDEVPA